MNKKNFFSGFKKVVLPVVGAGVIFSGCQQFVDLPENKLVKKTIEKKDLRKTENFIENNNSIGIETFNKIDLVLTDTSTSEEKILKNENNTSVEVIDDEKIEDNISNIISNEEDFKDVHSKIEKVIFSEENEKKRLEIERKKQEYISFKKEIDKNFAWTLYKIFSNWKYSNLDYFKKADLSFYDNLENDLDKDYFNKLNDFRERILNGEVLEDVKNNIINELRFEYEENKSLYYNVDKIFTEARKIISGEKLKKNSFLNFYQQEIQKNKERSWIEKGEDFNLVYFEKRKNKIIKKFDLDSDSNFLIKLNSSINEVLNSKNRYKKLIEVRKKNFLFFAINPDSEKSFSSVLLEYVKTYCENFSFLKKKNFVYSVEKKYFLLSENEKKDFKKKILKNIEKNENLKYTEDNIRKTYQTAKKYMFAFLDKDVLKLVKKRIKSELIENEYSVVKNEFSEHEDFVSVFKDLNDLLLDLEFSFFSGMMTDDPFDFWKKKRDILKKENYISKRRYNSRFKSGIFDDVASIIRLNSAMDYYKTLSGEQVLELEDKIGIDKIVKYFGFSNFLDGVDFDIYEKYGEDIFTAIESFDKTDWLVSNLFKNKKMILKFILDEFLVESHGLITAYNAAEGKNAGIGFLQHIKIYRDEYHENPVLIEQVVHSRLEDLYRNFKFGYLKKFLNLPYNLKIKIAHQSHNSGGRGTYDSINTCKILGYNIDNFPKYVKYGQKDYLLKMKEKVVYFENKGEYNIDDFFNDDFL